MRTPAPRSGPARRPARSPVPTRGSGTGSGRRPARSDGSSASRAARTAEENRAGACMTTSTMNVRPPRRSWVRCRSRSAMARSTCRTVLVRTPPRRCSTRSTVASLRPAWTAISRTRNSCCHPAHSEVFLRSFQAPAEAVAGPKLSTATSSFGRARPMTTSKLATGHRRLVPAGGLPPGRLPRGGRADHRPGRLPARRRGRAGRAGLRRRRLRDRRRHAGAAGATCRPSWPGRCTDGPGHRGVHRRVRRPVGASTARPRPSTR